jgi:hypothetical protein
MAKADKALTARRTEDLLRIRLDGAQWWDIRDYVRAKEGEKDSAWFRRRGSKPLSDSQIRRYQARADELVERSFERNRRRLFRQHIAKRRNLFARAVTTGDIRTALAVLQDEAKLTRLYPADTVEKRLAELEKLFRTLSKEPPHPTAGGPRLCSP